MNKLKKITILYMYKRIKNKEKVVGFNALNLN